MSNAVVDGLLRGLTIAQQLKGFQQQEQQSKLAADREARLVEQDRLTQERQQRMDEQERILTQLQTRRQIRSEGGKRLSAKEKAILDAGDDFSMEILPGFATTASSSERMTGPGGDEFLLPQLADVQRAQDSHAVDQEEAKQALGKIPLPAKLAEALGIPAGTPVKPDTIDDLLRAMPKQPDPVRLERLTDETDGDVQFVDPNSGKVISIFKGASKKRPPAPPRDLSPSEEKTQAEQYEESVASEILSRASRGGVIDFAAAERSAQEAAKQDPKVRKRLRGILMKIQSAKPRAAKGEGADPLTALFGIPAEQGATGATSRPKPTVDEAIDAFLSETDF